MNVGLIGAGAIATYVLGEMKKERDLKATSVFVRNEEKYKHLEEYGVTLYTDFEAFLNSGIDIVVEAAGVAAAKQWLPTVVQKKDVILISIGALADEPFLQEITEVLETNRS